jgi:branched-subunit amino acid transport protein
MNEVAVNWILLGGLAVTYGLRLSFLLLPNPEHFPALFRRGLRLVAPAVLAAILAPQVLAPEAGSAAAGLLRPAAILVAAAVGWRTRNTWLAIGSGMVALWLLQAWLNP